MDKLAQTILQARRDRRKALVPFLVADHPSPARFREALLEAARYADVIEIGVPFTDPLADGPVIQAAGANALAQGATMKGLFETLAGLQGAVPPPLVLMLSMNQVLAAGRTFTRRCADLGVTGLIVPDLPFEESTGLRATCDEADIALVAMLAPTTSEARARAILQQARGFIYLVSVTGVTGVRKEFSPQTLDYLRRVRAMTDKPLCVGFGISAPAQIAQLRDAADGFIVGSALVKALESGRGAGEVLEPLRAVCNLRV